MNEELQQRVAALASDLQEKEKAIHDLQELRGREEDERRGLLLERERWRENSVTLESRLADVEQQRELMGLRCPRCAARGLGGEMDIKIHNGVEIDLCRDCRGIYLDRGELETIVDWELVNRGQ